MDFHSNANPALTSNAGIKPVPVLAVNFEWRGTFPIS
jgi:hypothetical protein